MKRFFLLLILSWPLLLMAQGEKITISPDIELIPITENCFIHVSYHSLPSYGRVGSNGVVYIDNGKAFLFDTPMTEAMTQTLVEWLGKEMKLQIVGFVPNHWHSDCTGGLAFLKKCGIPTYANQKTIDILSKENLPLPETAFNDSLTLWLNDKKVECFYPGAAHAIDNIVVWIPAEKILFAGCMVKEVASATLGNTADGDLSVYPATIQRVKERYPEAKFVVPGHGLAGGKELVEHTLSMALRNKPSNQ
jgi:Zn-dependent hydrolases, including glyoxylases